MTVKTITITEDAYETIRRLKIDDESFSNLFKRLGERYATFKDIRGVMKHTPDEAKEFAERAKKIREKLGKSMKERVENVRSRYKRFN